MPWSRVSRGLGSKVSTCDGPPGMKRKITRCARGGQCGTRAPAGRRTAPAAAASSARSAARASEPKPRTRPPQHLAAARQHPGEIAVDHARLRRLAGRASSIDVDKFVLAQDQLAISLPRIDARSGASNSQAEVDLGRSRRPAEGEGVEPADARLDVRRCFACRPVRPVPGPDQPTNGSFRKNRACGATTDSPRRPTIEPGSARSNSRPKSVAAGPGAHRHEGTRSVAARPDPRTPGPPRRRSRAGRPPPAGCRGSPPRRAGGGSSVRTADSPGPCERHAASARLPC